MPHEFRDLPPLRSGDSVGIAIDPPSAVESARMANLSVPSPISTFVARPLLKCSLVQIPVNLAQNEEQKNTKKKRGKHSQIYFVYLRRAQHALSLWLYFSTAIKG